MSGAKGRSSAARAAGPGGWRQALSEHLAAFTPAVQCLLASYICLAIVFGLSIQLYGPFLRTLVVCQQRHGSAEAAASGLAGLSAGFSGSALCDDAHLVLAVAQAEEGRLVGMKLLVHGCAGPVIAVFADSRGRRPVLLLALGGFTAAFFLFALVAANPWLHQSTHLVAMCFLVEGATGAFDVTYLSMLADLAPDENDRAKLFTAYYCLSSLGNVAGQLASVWILRQQLAAYTLVWLALAGILSVNVAFAFGFVGESLSTAKAAPLGRGGGGRCAGGGFRGATVALQVLAAPLQLVRSHRFLSLWLLGTSLGHLAHGLASIEASFTLAAYGWSPGDLQACTWPGQALQVWALVLLGPFLSRCRASHVIFLTALVHCSAALAEVLAPFSPALLIGPSLLSQLVATLGRPSATAFLSSHFSVDQQAKLHSVTHLCANVSTSLSIALFSTELFAPEASGWAAAPPFLLAAFFSCSGGGVRLALVLSEMRGESRKAKKIAEESEEKMMVI